MSIWKDKLKAQQKEFDEAEAKAQAQGIICENCVNGRNLYLTIKNSTKITLLANADFQAYTWKCFMCMHNGVRGTLRWMARRKNESFQSFECFEMLPDDLKNFLPKGKKLQEIINREFEQ